MTDSGLLQALKTRGAAAGVPEVFCHQLRHQFAHEWLAAGGQEHDLMTLAGWRSTEAFGWRSGLDRTLTRAPQFYAVIVAATLVGVAINFLGINPITALVLSAVLNGLVAAPLLVLVMLVSNDAKAMGQRTNGRLLNVVGWATTAVMAVAAVALVVTTVLG